MKRICMIFVCWVAILAAGTSLKAQEATITLMPGWTWIGYPKTEALDLAMALGDFVPMEGDIIKSQYGFSQYQNGEWSGNVLQLGPSLGYQYFSNRTEIVVVSLSSTGSLPTVITSTPTDITTYGMTCGGEVTDSGNSGVLVRGVCWSTQQNPTINDPHTTDGYGMGSFSSAVEGLEMNTTYYVRAYALTTSGAGYGEQMMFSTKNGVPTLTTSAASEIGTTWATCGGDISDDGGMEITERGICWSTTSNPTIEGDHGSNGAGLGSFTVNMNNLEANTTYYVRAYATNSYTTAYGNEVFFRTEVEQTWPNGKLPGQFSVSETHQVQFSQGNLQYLGSAATPYWRFAEHQWDYFGTTTGQNSSDQNVDRDLFGWGTSGWDNGNMYYQPYNTEQFWDSNTGYGYGPTDGTNYTYDLTGNYANADWGVYNAILNGGNASHQWRTLTYDEWQYLINTRTTTSGIRYAKAQVYGVNGLVVLPDDWDASIYGLNYTNNTQAPFNSNVIADADWASMEVNGAVFLPAAGYRMGTYMDYYYAGYSGNYWSASLYYMGHSQGLGFHEDSFYGSLNGNDAVCSGRSVRLVSVTLPEVSTTTVSCVLDNSAIVGGNITSDGNADISLSGICYSTSQNPTIDDILILTQGVTIGEFELIIDELTPNTTYYVRAFATNSSGTAYGEEISFITAENAQLWQNGILLGSFSVSEDQQINFSQGNLQYIGSAATPYWKFAEHQWDYLGTTTGQNSDSMNVDRDLFGWGTSGYSHGAVCYQPWSRNTTYSYYYAYGNYWYNLYEQSSQADWGYNPISNGGNQENQWRTLTTQEWQYLFNLRSTASGLRYAKAQVFGVNGVILLPDDWNENTYSLSNINSSDASFNSNTLTAGQWANLEQAGAVFLPAAGNLGGTSMFNVNYRGYYWSASHYNTYYACNVDINGYSLNMSNNYRYYGYSVRLVRTVHSYSIGATPNPAEGGTVTGQGNYNSDATCTLTATPNEGYIFTSWTENGEVVSTEATYSFTVTNDRTLVANFLQGAINGQFTINANGDKVYFAKGNLQYNKTTNEWSFMEHQYDRVETQTQNVGENYANQNIVSLFGWGTSGYHDSSDLYNVNYQPWSTSMVTVNETYNYFGYGPSTNMPSPNLTGSSAQYDWGVHNSINNATGQWRMLTGGDSGEWYYIFNTRSASTVNGVANARYAKAKVANVQGVILFPDSYTHPSGVAQPVGINETGNAGWNGNDYSVSDFALMQAAGAVFLPAAGYRNGNGVDGMGSIGSYGNYWSASCSGSHSAYFVVFLGANLIISDNVVYRYRGHSVRLVCPCQY